MIEEIAIDLIKELVLKMIESKINDLDYFKKRKIKSRVEDTIADVV
jgi:hypothetical protein